MAAEHERSGQGVALVTPEPGHEVRHKVAVGTVAHKGRALFARAAIAAGELIEAAPVVVVDAAECARLDTTVLQQYYFHWAGDYDGDGSGAVALGYVTLCNHSAHPNAEVRRNYERSTLDLLARRAIAPGEEVTIDYGCPLWFEVRD